MMLYSWWECELEFFFSGMECGSITSVRVSAGSRQIRKRENGFIIRKIKVPGEQ